MYSFKNHLWSLYYIPGTKETDANGSFCFARVCSKVGETDGTGTVTCTAKAGS